MSKSFIDNACTAIFFVLLIQFAFAQSNRVFLNEKLPCKTFTLYLHDTLFNVTNADNATSSAVTNATGISNFQFGTLIVFDDPLTLDQHILSSPVARAQGFFFYDMKTRYNAWFAFSVIFNSSDYVGTLNLMGADMMNQKTRDISVVGGTGDFFMTRGIATLKTDAAQGFAYFRLKMDIKLYECYY
ncbi:dirigent protein 5-like [Papaver somniferum]|uniref:dirigent protein 5-like n=1 Tax=Papaver somniferum TaxID=3469 RepID=UPI000E6FD773|nr:dirigent protein 5-like [Papaver somniferum]